MVSLSRSILKMMPSCVIFSSPLSLMPIVFLSPRPVSSTPTGNPACATRKPFQSWCKYRPMTGRPWPTSPRFQCVVATSPSREPIPRLPLSSAIVAGGLVTSNPVARTPPSAPSAPAPILRQSTIAPTRPVPKVETSSQFSTAVLPPVPDAPTAPRITQQATGTARLVLYLPLEMSPAHRRPGQPPRPPPPILHLNPPLHSCLHLILTPWIPKRTRHDLPFPLPHPPPRP